MGFFSWRTHRNKTLIQISQLSTSWKLLELGLNNETIFIIPTEFRLKLRALMHKSGSNQITGG